ncbi:flavodoxin family protein [Gottfriedia sp. NPDC056225]|uniref:flavodoxin family protein n=1 Tax=Gottfriedia sp. NPDC056225 TaxID=3345751 RepID=UPI001559BF2E|nr:flavodoxin family protein [Arthrobacter citreus]
MFIIHGSSRENGNTEQLTNLMTKNMNKTEVHLRHKNIMAINDQRHEPSGFQTIDDDYEEIIKEMLEHDTIIFSTPLYWYGMSGYMKNFIDRWSQSLRNKDLHFSEKIKNKKMYVVIVGGDQPKIKALPLILQFKHIFEFVGATFEGYIIGEGNSPGAILEDDLAIQQAELLNSTLKNK